MKKYSTPKLTTVEKTLGAADFFSEFGNSFEKAVAAAAFGGSRTLAKKDFALEPCLA